MTEKLPKLLPIQNELDTVDITKLEFIIKHFDLFLYEKDVKTTNIKYISEKGLNKKYGDNFYSFIKNGWLKYFLRSDEPELVLQWFNICQTNCKIRKLSPKSATNRVFPNSPKKLIECILPSITPITQRGVAIAKYTPPIAIPRTERERPMSRRSRRGSSASRDGENKEVIKNPDSIGYNKKIWIALGINKYKHLESLENAVNDAKTLTEFSKEKLNFTHTKMIINKEVTKKRIEYEIKNYLFRMSNPEDLVVLSFHVHGITLNIDGSNHGFIAPYNAPNDATPAELISMSDISNWTKYMRARHVLILFDCCFAGFSSLRKTSQSSEFSTYTIKKMLTKKSRIAINAGTHDQTVSDGGWNKNSIFTGVFLSYPFFNEKKGSVTHLYNYLLINVPKYYPQTPTMGKLIGDEGGDIFLSL